MKLFSQQIKKILFIIFLQLSTCLYAQIEDVVVGIFDGARIYLDGSNLFFSNGGRIDVVDLTDESNPTVSLFQEGFSFAAGMAIYNDEFYVAEFGQGRIVKFSLNEVNPDIIEVTNTGLSPNVIVVHNDFLYYSDNNGGSIYKYDLNGDSNESELLVSGYTGVVGLATKDDFLYFSVSINGGIIYKIDLLDPDANPIALVAGDHPLGIKIYGDILYVADQDLDLILSFDTNEEPVQNIEILNPLIGYIDSPSDIAIYGSYFYVLENDSLLRIPLSDLNINLGINEFEEQKTFSIYPNPTTQYIQLTNIETQEEFIIYDVNGREVLKGVYEPNTQINVNNLESGLYYIKLKGKSCVHRFVIC
ncbi:MAG: T9SS type A sorting domain-containing protein [Winogradskyella sp.]